MELSQPVTSLQSLTQQKMKISIVNYTVGGNYYMNLCEKKPENIGFTHPRLLVFEQVQGIIYYVNCPEKWPIKDQNFNTPKNQKIPINLCELKNQSGNELTISYNKKSDKDKVVAGQWIFITQTKNVAREWVNLIYAKKSERITNAILNSPLNKQQKIEIQEPQTNFAGKNTLDPNLNYSREGSRIKNETQKKIEQSKISENKKQIEALNNSMQSNKQPQQSKISENKSVMGISQKRNADEINNSKMSIKNNQQANLSSSSYARGRESTSNILNPNSQLPYTQINIKNPPAQVNQRQSTISGVQNRNSAYQNLPSQKKGNTVNFSEIDEGFKKQQKNEQPNKPSYSPSLQGNTIRPNVNDYSGSSSNKYVQKREIKNKKIDWNLKFLQERTEITIKDYSLLCLQVFMSLGPNDICLRAQTQSKDQQLMPHKTVRQDISFYMAEYGTRAAQNLRKQFKNYHYILESCRENRIFHVPMTCMIQYLGIVCLAKANFPQPYELVDLGNNSDPVIIQQLRSLEIFTKISSESLKKNGILSNLTKRYGKQGKNDLIYIDNLVDYLPWNPECNGCLIRPELIQENISKVIHPRSPDYQNQISGILSNSVHKLSELLSEHELTIASFNDLQSIIHDFGLNKNMLPNLYNLVRSKFVKKYLYTAMVCAVTKEDIIMSIIQMRESKQMNRILEGVQQIFRIYLQAHHNDPAYVELWKNVDSEFKRKYQMKLNIKEIEPGFFLSSMMSIINGEYDIDKIDKSKILLEQKNIISKGFISNIKPVVKCYSNYCTEKSQKIINLCKYPLKNIQEITNIMPLKQIKEKLPEKHQKQVYARLSSILSPFSENKELISNIYKVINQEPLCLTSHSITVSYADHCQRAGKNDEYKKTMETAVDIINYWLGEQHILICDIFQSLADYYESKSQVQDCINYMKQALTTCIRQTGTHTHRVGLQYFKLAQKQLKYGENKDAMENYYKYKNNAESNARKSIHYPISLMRLGNLQLNQGQVQKCIMSCIRAIKFSEQIQIPDTTLIKVFDLLSRAYEINQNRQELINLSHLTAKMFNSTSNTFAFDQMIRICLVGFVGALQPGRQDKFRQYLKIGKLNNGQQRNRLEATNRLMDLATRYVVMQHFKKGIQDMDRYISEIRHGRALSGETKQFRLILECIIEIVGLDFVEGILQQSQYW